MLGQYVAVKLLLPNMETKFRSDIYTLKTFCELAMPQHVSSFREIEKQFLTEFDYLKEGINLNSLREKILRR
jgi:predicted unusual protein kinase regulating ubiquinone biosynthesis (AarF/ABC1/UbiB family)